MLDAIMSEAAVFEPNEVKILKAAFDLACGNLSFAAAEHSRMALLVHNLGRSRLRFSRTLKTHSDLRDIVGQAVEIFTYMDGQEMFAVAHAPPSDNAISKSIPSRSKRTTSAQDPWRRSQAGVI